MNKRTKKKFSIRRNYKTYAKYRAALGIEAVQEYYDETNKDPNRILDYVEITYTRPSCKYIKGIVTGYTLLQDSNA